MTKNYIEFFRAKANAKNIFATDMVTLCLFKALRSKSEDKVAVAQALLKAAFSPITRLSVLANGGGSYHALNVALSRVKVNLAFRVAEVNGLTEEQQAGMSALAVAVGRF